MAKRKSAKTQAEITEHHPCTHLVKRFNLVDEPWIPVVWTPDAKGLSGRDGIDAQPAELGLQDALLHAHEIAGMADSSPLVTASTHRLLIALVHAIYRGPERSKDWAAMWQAGNFDPAKVREYCEEWHERFWLFHPVRPFLQWPGEDLGNPVPITRLNLAAAAGATLFDHSLDTDALGFAWSEAASQLMAFLAFKPGGFVEGVLGPRADASALGAPWADGAAFLSLDKNLFGTLMMNLVLPANRNGTVSELGTPEWQRSTPSARTPPTQGLNAGPPAGYLELLTAPCRHIRLCEPDLFGLVRHVRLQLGTVFSVGTPLDPAKAYWADKKLGWRALGLHADRALWRDSATLLKPSSKEHAPAGALTQIASLNEDGIIPDDLTVGLAAFGTIGSRARIDLWRAETLPVPVAVLGNSEHRVLIKDCLGLTEAVEKALRSAVWTLVCDLVPKSKEEKDRKALRDHLDISKPFWTRLETRFKRDVLVAVLTDDRETVRRHWAESCMALAREVLAKALDGLAASGETLRAGAEGERTLLRQLQEVRKNHNLNEEEEHVEDAGA